MMNRYDLQIPSTMIDMRVYLSICFIYYVSPYSYLTPSHCWSVSSMKLLRFSKTISWSMCKVSWCGEVSLCRKYAFTDDSPRWIVASQCDQFTQALPCLWCRSQRCLHLQSSGCPRTRTIGSSIVMSDQYGVYGTHARLQR